VSDLRATQEAMRAALHEGQAARLLPMVEARAGVGLPPERRVEVYRTMYWARLSEALASDFPLVQRLIGDELFDRVVVTHVKRHPSRSPSLALLGRDLDETLLHLGLEAEAAVARLEWARVEAFWAPQAEVATRASLRSLGDKLGDAVLVLHPSLRLVTLPAFVRGVAAGGAVGDTEAGEEEPWVVWRRGSVVTDRRVSTVEAAALTRALRGEGVSAVCEPFLDTEAPEAAAITALLAWVGDGWVSGARL